MDRMHGVKLYKFSSNLQHSYQFSPSNGKATFVHRTRARTFLKTISTPSCWYSLDSSHYVFSDEYPYARVSVIFRILSHPFVFAKLVTSRIRVKSQKWPSRRGQSDFSQVVYCTTGFHGLALSVPIPLAQ